LLFVQSSPIGLRGRLNGYFPITTSPAELFSTNKCNILIILGKCWTSLYFLFFYSLKSKAGVILSKRTS
jgi:hypothetical protein